MALEVFLNDGYTHLLVLDVQEREPVFKSLLGHAKYPPFLYLVIMAIIML